MLCKCLISYYPKNMIERWGTYLSLVPQGRALIRDRVLIRDKVQVISFSEK